MLKPIGGVAGREPALPNTVTIRVNMYVSQILLWSARAVSACISTHFGVCVADRIGMRW